MLELKVLFSDREESTHIFSPAQFPVRIGRAEGAHVQIDNIAVSRQHATIDLVGRKIVIVDDDSDNGFGVNDQEQVRVAVLSDGDVIRLGKYSIQVKIDVVRPLDEHERRFQPLGKEKVTAESTMQIQRARPGEGGSGRITNRLVVTRPHSRTLPLAGGHIWIGAAGSNDLVVRGLGVARKHCVVYLEGEHARLVDLTGKGKVRVNGQRTAECTLSGGERIQIGRLEMEYRL